MTARKQKTPELGTEPARSMPLLTTGERNSSLFIKLTKHFEARLDMLRKQNDADLDTEATAKQRGRIAEIKAMLEHGKEPIQVE